LSIAEGLKARLKDKDEPDPGTSSDFSF